MSTSAFVLTEQIKAQQRVAGEPDLAVRLMADLRRIWPAGYLPADDKVLYNRVYWSLRSSREYGVKDVGLRQKWISLGSCFLPYFWLQDNARAYLSQPGHDPETRFADYHAIIKSVNNRQTNPWPLV
jgi:hypothetical protein